MDIATGYALFNGRRAIYMLVTKRAEASTLNVVNEVKEALPKMQAILPDDIHVSFEFDQSPYVTRSMWGLATEGALGAVLTGLMVLIFLRDWRSALVVVLNIPLALAAAVVALWLCGQSINLMTLGGLALAVGILVDEATVEVENIHKQFEHTPNIARAVRLGNAQTAIPRLLAMLCILAVFMPSFFMQGAARALFVPLSLAVGFAMLASYLLSSTFVPVLSVWLLRHVKHSDPAVAGASWFGQLRATYARLSQGLLPWRGFLVLGYLAASSRSRSCCRGGQLGTEIFPLVDAGQFRIRLRAKDGTHFSKTESIALDVLRTDQRQSRRRQRRDDAGLCGHDPLELSDQCRLSMVARPEEGILLVSLKRGSRVDVERLKEELRAELAKKMPDLRRSFEPADIVNEVMSFGSPTPIDIAVSGPDFAESRKFSQKIYEQLKNISALRDLQFAQSLDYPTVQVKVDREKAGMSGVTEADVARSLVAATSSSRFVVAELLARPEDGHRLSGAGRDSAGGDQIAKRSGDDSHQDDARQAIAAARRGRGGAGHDARRVRPLQHEAAGEPDGQHRRRRSGNRRTPGSAGDRRGGRPPKGATVETCAGRFRRCSRSSRASASAWGWPSSSCSCLLTANFQSFKLALATVSTTPAVVAGVVLMLWITGTTINIQSFMGAIMAIGVAVANAILLVTFAENRRRAGETAAAAAIDGAAGPAAADLDDQLRHDRRHDADGAGLGRRRRADCARWAGPSSADSPRRPWRRCSCCRASMPFCNRMAAGTPPRSTPTIPIALITHRKMCKPFCILSGLAAILVSIAIGCSPTDVAAPAKAAAPRVTVVRPQRKTLRYTIEEPGQIEGFEEAPLYAKLAAYVGKVNVDIGQQVDEGDVLAVLRIPELNREFEQKVAAVKQATAELAHSKAVVAVAAASVTVRQGKARGGPGGNRADRGRLSTLEIGRRADRRIGRQRSGHPPSDR